MDSRETTTEDNNASYARIEPYDQPAAVGVLYSVLQEI